MAYLIKQIPADFIVEEIIDLKFNKTGRYSYFLLEKKELTTQKAISIVARLLHTDEKFINFAGIKDKQGITKQYISVNSCSLKKDFEQENLSLKYLGDGIERINLGSNLGNKFRIVVRNLEKKDKADLEIKSTINYFDEQRFSKNNAEIGFFLLKRKFKEACELIDDENSRSFLEKNNADYIGALRRVPKRILSIYVNAYQSKLWNKTVAELLKNEKNKKKVKYSQGEFIFSDKVSQKQIPILGFGSALEGKAGKIIKDLMNKDKLTQRDFIFREIPELSSEGTVRNILSKVKNFSYSYESDELNTGKIKCTLVFELGAGSYATIVIKNIFS